LYSTNEIETALLTSYTKAKKYKRKAKKLYNNLAVLKEHYSKAKGKIKTLERENSMLTQRLMLFSERIDDLERTYEAYNSDRRIEEIVKENEYLK
jgi:predicted RNase H-like nuclease (RuvC/YqgF family)